MIITEAYVHHIDISLKQRMTEIREKRKIAQGDRNADQFVLRFTDADDDFSLGGVSVTAAVKRVDGVTVPLIGSVEDDTAVITLDEHCYEVPGEICMTVTLSAGEVTRSVLVVTMDVSSKFTGVVVGNVVLVSIEEFLTAVADMKQATHAIDGMTVDAVAGNAAAAQISDRNGVKHIHFTIPVGSEGGGGGGIVIETDPTVPDWAKAANKPAYTKSEVGLGNVDNVRQYSASNPPPTPTAQQVGADASGTAAAKVSAHNTDDEAHSDIRTLISGLTQRLNSLADSDDTTLDQLSEIVAYIKSNKSLIDNITTGKVNVSDIVNNLTTNATNKPLSAAQGVALKKLINAIVVPTKTSQLDNDSGYLTEHQDISGLLPRSELTDYVHITPGTDGEKAENIREDESVVWTDGLYVNYQNGTTSQHASYVGSEHYFVLPDGGRVFGRFKNNTLYYPTVAFYDDKYAYLSGEYPVLSSTDERDEYNGMYGYFYTIPEGAKYYRVSFGTTAKANLEIYLISPVKVGGRVEIPDLVFPRSGIDGKTVVCFGDSLFGMYRGEDSATAFIAKETGATVHNVGFGGCRMSVHPTSGYAAFSMWALAKAIAENDWTTQDAQASSGSSYFPEQLALLKSIDFSKVDIAVIHYGTNDFAAGVGIPIDNASDPDDYNTLCGALRYSLDKLLGAYPKLRIYVSLPVYRYWTSDGTTTYAETYLSKLGKTLPEFVEALRSTAAEYNLPVIDGYYSMGINKANASTFLEDGTHHNATGRERFGRYIGANLASQQTSGKSGVDMTAVQALIDNSIGIAIGGEY